MKNTSNSLGKIKIIGSVAIASYLISWGIKQWGPSLPIPSTSTSAALIVITPPIILALALIWRSFQSTSLP